MTLDSQKCKIKVLHIYLLKYQSLRSSVDVMKKTEMIFADSKRTIVVLENSQTELGNEDLAKY